MAEDLILLVLEKIGAIVADEAIKSLYSEFEKEVSLLLEAERGIKQIAAEFRVIMAFLSQTETIERNDRIFEAWLQEVREVAHEVEDVLDEYAHITDKICSRSTHWFKRMFYKSKNIVSWHAIANQLKGIETSLQKISDMRSRYDIKFQGENSPNIVSKRQELTTSSSYRIDQDELVGIEEERTKLIMWLKDDETVERSTITVSGMWGLGKTSLVKSVLNSGEVKEHFDCYMWISVSQKYEVDDVLKKIIEDALVSMHEVPVDTKSMDHRNLEQTARKTLDGKKYLIIFDDVWRRNVCNDFRDTFVDNCNGSKIVLSSSLGNSLQKLRLVDSMLREDPLPSLFHLSNLTSLVLGGDSYDGQQLWFRRGWFPHLTNLSLIRLPNLEKVEIENGALQSLEDLCLKGLDCLVSVPSGIEFLFTLKVLWLRSVRDELVERIKEVDYSMISHIPTIHHVSHDLIHTNLSLLLKKGRG